MTENENLKKKIKELEKEVEAWKNKERFAQERYQIARKQIDNMGSHWNNVLSKQENEYKQDIKVFLKKEVDLRLELNQLKEEYNDLKNDWDYLVYTYNLQKGKLNEWKLWFPNQTPQKLAQSFSQLDSKLQSIKKEAKRWKDQVKIKQAQIDNHKCSGSLSHSPIIVNNVNCSHNDYNQLKNERDRYKNQLENHKCNLTHCSSEYHQKLIKDKESQIVSKIITELELSTNREQENVLEIVIKEIKSRINPPSAPHNNSNDKQRIKELETKLAQLQSDRHKPTPEIVEKVSEHIKDINRLSIELRKAPTYSHLLDIKQEEIKGKLASEIRKKCQLKQLSIGLGILSVSSLLTLIVLMVKIAKNKRIENEWLN